MARYTGPIGRHSGRDASSLGMPERSQRDVDLVAAAGRPIPDLVGPGLRVLFCGINPGLWSAATGLHFAGPGNRFWKVLHGAGFTDRVLDPADQGVLPSLGLGITNLVSRSSAAASELTAAELRKGAALLEAKVARLRPGWLAFVGMQAYRTAFRHPRAGVGRQEGVVGAGTGIWVLPNTSGLQAAYPLAAMVAAYGELRRAAEEYPAGPGVAHAVDQDARPGRGAR